jgi:NTP pyrophosphatase (non-canonical NTP hydrolase)
MNMDDFQEHALKSVVITQKGIAALSHRTLGLTGEAGILANQVKKIIRDKDGHFDAADIEEAKKRLGDVLYYTAVLAEYFGLSMSQVAKQNMYESTAFKNSRLER